MTHVHFSDRKQISYLVSRLGFRLLHQVSPGGNKSTIDKEEWKA